MRTNDELVYWVKFAKLIHYDKKKNVYRCDADLPERARKSFEAWAKHNNKKLNIVYKR